MSESIRPLLLKATVGMMMGFIIWAGFGSAYTKVVAGVAGGMIGLAERPRATELQVRGSDIILNRTDFPSSPTRPSIPFESSSYNIILLMGLFAIAPRPMADRNVIQFAKAVLVLSIVHVLALITQIQAIYALHLGAWSLEHYGNFARVALRSVQLFYPLYGVHAVPFALWLLFSDSLPLIGERRQPRVARNGKDR